MRKGKWIYVTAGALLTASLSGCGNDPYANRPEIPPVRNYETREAEENTAEETQEAVNVSIEEEMELLIGRLQETGNQQEVMSLLAEESWLQVFLPEGGTGSGSFEHTDAAGTVDLMVTAGYDEAGAVFVRVWYLYGENHVQYLERTGTAWRIADTAMADGLYQGDFDIWFCTAAQTVYHEQGIFSNGVCVGEYTAQVYQGAGEGDVAELWGRRDSLEMQTFTGSFTEAGRPECKQPVGEAGVTALAYGEDKKQYLAVITGAEQETVFGCSLLGMKAYPRVQGGSEDADLGQDNSLGMDVYGSRSVVGEGQSAVGQGNNSQTGNGQTNGASQGRAQSGDGSGQNGGSGNSNTGSTGGSQSSGSDTGSTGGSQNSGSGTGSTGSSQGSNKDNAGSQGDNKNDAGGGGNQNSGAGGNGNTGESQGGGSNSEGNQGSDNSQATEPGGVSGNN